MATGEIVGSIFFAADELLRVEELTVGSGSHFIDDSWFEIDKHSTRNVFAGSGFAEESVEGVITTSHGVVTWHLPIRLTKNSRIRLKSFHMKKNNKTPNDNRSRDPGTK